MNHANVQSEASVTSLSSRRADTRLRGPRLVIARIVWGVLVVFILSVFLVSLPVYVTLLQTECSGVICSFGRLAPDTVRALQGIGLSLGAYVALTVALTAAFAIVSLTIAGVLVWRKSDDLMALVASLMLVLISTANVSRTVGENSSTSWSPLVFVNIVTFGVLFLVFSLFPDGRFVPRWTLWLTVVFLAWRILFLSFPGVPFFDVLDNLIWIASFSGLAAAQIYRYRWVSGPVQRQQTKWVVFSLTVMTLVGLLPGLIFPSLNQPGSLATLANDTLFNFVSLFLPLSFGIAILRYRLWDIDVIINRTLVYGTLTAILALVYFGLIFALQYLLRGIINQNNDVAIIISTLAIAALFQPLRHRIQKIIDRRFYRSKYDAARTLAAFSVTLRNEVDLSQLTAQLLEVVEETMQPAHISLWLRKSDYESKRHLNR